MTTPSTVPGIDCWTDYPIVELGDEPNKEAPVRPCRAIGFDGNKYATVEIGGVTVSFKAGYLYSAAGRLGEVPKVPTEAIVALPYVD